MGGEFESVRVRLPQNFGSIPRRIGFNALPLPKMGSVCHASGTQASKIIHVCIDLPARTVKSLEDIWISQTVAFCSSSLAWLLRRRCTILSPGTRKIGLAFCKDVSHFCVNGESTDPTSLSTSVGPKIFSPLLSSISASQPSSSMYPFTLVRNPRMCAHA